MRNLPITQQANPPSLVTAFDMTATKRSGRRDSKDEALEGSAQVERGLSGPGSAPVIFAKAFHKLDLERRARLLGRLLGSVGPLGLVVIGGGHFAKYLRNARSCKVPLSLEDAARATPRQVYDVVRYVEQSNPRLVESLLVAFWRDRTTASAPCA